MYLEIFYYPRRFNTKWAVAYPQKKANVWQEQILTTASSYTEALKMARELNAELMKKQP